MVSFLLDTHALLWWPDGDKPPPLPTRSPMESETDSVLTSVASALEITTKIRLGKLPGTRDVARGVRRCAAGQGPDQLAIMLADTERARRIPGPHRDPFGWMLITQALVRDLVPVSIETLFDYCGMRRLRQRADPCAS